MAIIGAAGTVVAGVIGAAALLISNSGATVDAPPSPPSVSAATTGPASRATGPANGPIDIELVRLERNDLQGDMWVARQPIDLSREELATLNKLKSTGESDQWLREHGAIDPVQTNIKAVLRNEQSQPARIVAMQADTQCRKPVTGTIFDSPPAGAEENELIGFKLDDPRPSAQLLSPRGEWKGDYFSQRTISLKPGEDIVLQIRAITLKHYCTFRLEFDVNLPDETVTQTMTHDGEPFEVSAYAKPEDAPNERKYQRVYIGGVANPNTKGAWEQVK